MSPLAGAGPAAARWLADVPVAPSAERARDLVRGELSRQVYRDAEPGLLERAVRAVLDALSDLRVPTGSSALSLPALAVVLLLVAAAVVLAVRLTGPVRRTRSRDAGPVLAGRTRSAAQLRGAADAAAAQGRWSEAVAMRFRAVVRGLQERDLLASTPGLTAGEAGAGAALALPEHAAALRWAADLFDGVVYGGHAATAQDAEELRALDAAVERARQQLAGAGAGAAGGADAGRGRPPEAPR